MDEAMLSLCIPKLREDKVAAETATVVHRFQPIFAQRHGRPQTVVRGGGAHAPGFQVKDLHHHHHHDHHAIALITVSQKLRTLYRSFEILLVISQHIRYCFGSVR